MSETIAANESPPPTKRRRRWWVRLVHPIGWTFWLVTMPLVALFNLWLVLFCPWLPDFEWTWQASKRWVFGVQHKHHVHPDDPSKECVAGTVFCGPLIVFRLPSFGAGTLTRGFHSHELQFSDKFVWQYGWGGTDKKLVDDGIILIWIK